MKRSIHRFACTALALIALILTGAVTQCPLRGLVVEVPDLDANQIQGLQLWRAEDETSQTFDENCRIVFGESHMSNGSEMMEYTLLNPEGEPVPIWSYAAVDRGEGENDPVRLYFIFGSWSESPGWFRVTTFNSVGESDLSDEAIFL
jgi:hypothetical protein